MLVYFHEYPELGQSIACAIGDIILSCSTKINHSTQNKKKKIQFKSSIERILALLCFSYERLDVLNILYPLCNLEKRSLTIHMYQGNKLQKRPGYRANR